MSVYPAYKAKRSLFLPDAGKVPNFTVEITTDKGVKGYGNGGPGGGPIVEEHLTKLLIGKDPFDIERNWDIMWRSTMSYGRTGVTMDEVGHAFVLGLITLLRVVVLIAIASVVWVPIGVLIGLRPRLAEKMQPLAQFLAAFPANLLFPVFVIVIVRFHLNPDIWLSPLIVLGTQWYILFNVIAGASAYPNDYREAATNFRIRGWQWWRQAILPGIFPYYVTGAITASGGAWNASIVSEAVQWGNTKIEAHGLGAYIAQTTAAGDFPKIILGIAVMSLFVTLFNRLLWRPLYAFAEAKLRLD